MDLEIVNGKRCIALDESVKGAFLVTFGDTDHDGESGVRAVAFVDIPFDGDDLVKPIIDTGELESVPAKFVGSRVGSALKFLGSLADGLIDLVKK